LNDESVIRLAAVVAAVALLAAPYRDAIAGWLSAATEAASKHRSGIARLAAAGLLIAAAWGKIPMPRMPEGAAPSIVVETPSVEMQALVQPVADAMKGMPAGDRLLWAQVWTKSGVVVAGDAHTTEVVFTDTRSLRAFTALALDIAWRRIGQHAAGSNEPLRAAVENAYGQVLGKDVVPVTADMRARYVELAKAIAWAGQKRG
jgi:hypothetical protein